MTRSALAIGRLRHRRHRPRPHAFGYRVHHVLLDLEELTTLDREIRGFGYNRAALTSFHDRDHLGPADVPIREKLDRWLAGRGVARPAGRVLLWTNLRVLGYEFNPVSWFLCFDLEDRLALVVAEVHNTFGDQYGYVLTDLDRTGPHRVEARAVKRFHVSPFLPIDGLDYRFVLRPPAATPRPGAPVAVHMDVTRGGDEVFDATLAERTVPLTGATLARTLVTHPLMTVRTITAIHWQALKLAWKRVPFHRRPAPPDPGYAAVTDARVPATRTSVRVPVDEVPAHEPVEGAAPPGIRAAPNPTRTDLDHATATTASAASAAAEEPAP